MSWPLSSRRVVNEWRKVWVVAGVMIQEDKHLDQAAENSRVYL